MPALGVTWGRVALTKSTPKAVHLPDTQQVQTDQIKFLINTLHTQVAKDSRTITTEIQ